VERLRAALPFARIRIETDAVAAAKGALRDEDGIVAALGTGSVFAAQRGGEVRQIGGWGLVLGDEGSGLFFKVSAKLDAALVFSPFHIYGLMELRGQLRLFIISISAWATLQVDAPDPVIVDGHACASIDLFFFEISGCIDIHVGPDQPALLEPPPLVDGMVLQSRSPALVQGQGTDRPIDAKLIDALAVGAVSADKNDPALKDLARVPIDAVPLLKLHAAPSEKGCATFTLPLDQPPRRFLVCSSELIEGDVPEAGVVYVRREGGRAIGGA